MSPKLSRQGSVTYVTLENGKTYKLETVLRQRQAEAVADEARDSATTRALWWRRATRSRDVPNSRASRADLSDNGSGAAAIRENANRRSFYDFRINLAAAYLARHTRQSAATTGDFLRAISRNGQPHRRDTMRELGISRQWYYALLRRFCRLLQHRDWADFLSDAEKV